MLKSANKTWILNATMVMADRVTKGNLRIDGDTIGAMNEHSTPDRADIQKENCINAEGMLVLPGLIDIHSDAIEKEVEPRPNAIFPMDLAIMELEKKLAATGITTMYHSVSLGVGLSLRGDDLLIQLIDHIKKYRQHRARIRHRIHLRYELIHQSGMNLARELIHNGVIDYLSFMNHAPGQGQYKEPGSFEAYVMKNQGITQNEVKEIVENALKMQKKIEWNKLKDLADRARDNGIRIASHDDDGSEKIDQMRPYGISVSEFPINLEAAQYATRQNLSVCVGAPNVVRGASHSKNLRAIEAIQSGCADILCSDYMPSSLLPAVFQIANEDPARLPQAINMASLNPAKALGIERTTGSIECGKKADLLLVKIVEGFPFVTKTIVNGKCVYSADFFRTVEEHK